MLLLARAPAQVLEALVERQAVHRVDNEVAGLELEERLQRARLVDRRHDDVRGRLAGELDEVGAHVQRRDTANWLPLLESVETTDEARQVLESLREYP